MIKAEINIHKNKLDFEAIGALDELCADVSLIINIMYLQLCEYDKAEADLFKKFLTDSAQKGILFDRVPEDSISDW